MRVLVTGSSTFFGARLIQELGQQGAEITAADSLRLSCGKASRFVARRLLLPQLGEDPGGYLDAVVSELGRRRYDLLLPAFEETLLFSEYRDEICTWTRCLLPPFAAITTVHDKTSLHALCRLLGIPSPAMVNPNRGDDLEALLGSLRFPVLLKPPMGNNSVGRILCGDPEQAVREYRRWCRRSDATGEERPFIQQRIEGELVCTLMLCHEGRKLGEVIYRNLRTYPDGGGTSAHRESICQPDIAAITEKLAAETEWSGFLGLDFIVESGINVPYLIDANPRANPGTHLGYLAGVNWTALLVDLIGGGEPAAVTARPGLRTRSMMLDIAWLLEGLAPNRRWPQSAVYRLWRFLRPGYALDSRTDLLAAIDPLPTAVLTIHALRSMVKGWLTGQPAGKVILQDANYNAASVVRARLTGTPNASHGSAWDPVQRKSERVVMLV